MIGSRTGRGPISRLMSHLWAIVTLEIIFILVSVGFNFRSVSSLGVALLLGTLVFALVERKSNLTPWKESDIEVTETQARRIALYTGAGFSAAIGIVFFSILGAQYQKPFEYHVFIGVAAGFTVLEILQSRRHLIVFSSLLKSVILALTLFWTSQLVFPLGVSGADSFAHIASLAAPLVSNGFLPETDFLYVYFPVHHILVAQTVLITDIDVVTTYYNLPAIISIVGVPIAYILGRNIGGRRLGAICALVFSGNSYLIFWASHASALSYALPLALLFFVAVIRRYPRRRAEYEIILLLSVVALLFAHHYTTVIILLFLLALFLGSVLVVGPRTSKRWKIGGTAVLTIVAMFAHWAYYSLFLETSVGILQRSATVLFSEYAIATPTVYDYVPFSAILTNTIGSSILLFLAIIGFFEFSKRPRGLKIPFAALGFVFFLLVTAGTLFDIRYLLPSRMYVFLHIFALTFLGASGLLILHRRISLLTRGGPFPASLAVLVGALFLFSSASVIAGFETSPFASEIPSLKTYETLEERNGATWVNIQLPTAAELCGVSRSLPFISFHRNDLGSFSYPSPLTLVRFDSSGKLLLSKDIPCIIFSRFDIDPGYLAEVTSPGRYGTGELRRASDYVYNQLNGFHNLYDNGVILVAYDHES